MSTALLVGITPGDSLVSDQPGDFPNLRFQMASGADEALERLGLLKGEVDALVIGPREGNPIALAQRVYQLDRDLGILILAPNEKLAKLRGHLSISPFIGRQTRYFGTDIRAEIRSELLKAVSETRTRRTHRNTLHALSSKLSSSTVPKPQSPGVVDRLLELAPVGFLALDSAGKVIVANQAAQKLFENAEALVGAELSQLFDTSERPVIEALLRGAAETGLPERAQLERNAAIVAQTVEVILADLGGRGGGQGFLVILQDISERVRAEREREELLKKLEAAVQMRDDFLSVASHELRTPLAAIMGWLGLLRSGKLAPEKHARALETIERNARAQAQLIEDLLDVSRIVSGKVRLEVASVSLEDIIRQAAESVTPAAEAKAIQLQVLTDTVLGPVLGDPRRLQQVVWNLLSNAIKFTPKGGRVFVALRRVGSSAEVLVRDTGIGIPEEFLPVIFERFRQVETGSARSHGGLGLGLSIVRHFVELHGGTVSAFSEGKGKGATFVVQLPLSALSSPDRLPGAETSPPAQFECPAALQGVKVLLVEDEPDVRDLVVSLLTGCGLQVVAVGSAAEGLEALSREIPDVLISDIGMPGEDGYTFLRKVRALAPERGGKVPALAITAYSSPEERRKALLAGFQMHVPKPIPPEELLLVLATLTGRM